MIDYLKLGHAVLVAKTMGFKQVEVPWVVSPATADITRPAGAKVTEIKTRWNSPLTGQVLASGEVGLLQLREQWGQDEKLVTLTPCFRDEEAYDELHKPWFMKVELMIANPSDPDSSLYFVRHVAQTIMGTWSRDQVPMTTGVRMFDLNLNGIEVGSYGFREHDGFKWVYGTGLAEPRFSLALAGAKRSASGGQN